MPAPTNVPIDRTLFFGRDDELATIAALLARDDVGLLTLTGIGGTGKTRLALAAAGAAASAGLFADGVCFVDLAPVRDPDLVAAAVARALGVRERTDEALADTIAAAVGEGAILVVVDNCEHVLDVMALIGVWLARCPGLKVLATSRAPLGVHGERLLRIAPLPVPDLARLGDRPLAGVLALLERSPAVALFVSRAEAVSPGFALTADNARAVVDLCRGLDGLPLAIELAAGRAGVDTPAALCDRLDDRLALLTGGARDRPARQQTMRDSLAWSYELLDPEAQAVLRRLSVFVSGFTRTAAEATAGAHGPAALDRLAAHSLVRPLGTVAGEARYGMLEAMREFALEALAAAGEVAAASDALADSAAALAERALAGLQTPALDAWLERLDAEQGNLRAALAWCLAGDRAPATAVRIAGSLRIYWDVRGQLVEGRRWLDAALATPGPADEPRRVALNAAGLLAWRHGDVPAARARFEEALAVTRTLGNRTAEGILIGNLGLLSVMEGDYLAARELFLAGLALVQAAGNATAVAVLTNNVGVTFQGVGDSAGARPYYQAALDIHRRGGDPQLLLDALENLAEIDGDLGDVVAAVAGLEEVLAIRRARGDIQGTATTLGRLAVMAALDGRIGLAARRVHEGLALHRQVSDARGLVDGVAQAATLLGWPLLRPIHPARPRPSTASLPPLDDLAAAARLTAACAARRLAAAVPLTSGEQQAHDANVRALKAALGRRAFAAAWAAGEAVAFDDAVAEALAIVARLAARPEAAAGDPQPAAVDAPRRADAPGAPSTPTPTQAPPVDDGGLTPRELEVAALVTAGLTYAEMADRLGVSVKAIEKHMGNILAKLDARNRRDVALWGRARGLAT